MHPSTHIYPIPIALKSIYTVINNNTRYSSFTTLSLFSPFISTPIKTNDTID